MAIQDVLSGRSTWAVECCDCLQIMPVIPDASIDLLIADPPYFKVKDLAWDHQWKTAADYLAWIGELCGEWRRLLKPNGSLYVFASPQMAARVEVEIGKWFNVLSHIVWTKPNDPGFDGWKQKCSKESLQQWYPASERIIFAEQCGDDQQDDKASRAVRRGIFGEYLQAELIRAGVTFKEAAEAIGAYGKVNHGGSVSNWVLGLNVPSAEQYEKLRVWLNEQGGEFLNEQYGYLHRKYEYLRRKYEDLRRPFSVNSSVPYTDVWDFPTVQAAKGKHPCEKPATLLRHIVSVSSRAGALVLDPFAGSGALGEVCKELDRRYIGMEKDTKWARRAAERIEEYAPLFMRAETLKPPMMAAAGLFDDAPGGDVP